MIVVIAIMISIEMCRTLPFGLGEAHSYKSTVLCHHAMFAVVFSHVRWNHGVISFGEVRLPLARGESVADTSKSSQPLVTRNKSAKYIPGGKHPGHPRC